MRVGRVRCRGRPPTDADREFGALLEKARDGAGLTSQELAERMYVARETVDRYVVNG